jgi:diacylglycerol kinase family enzyme
MADGNDPAEAARAAVDEGANLVIAAGGDGTVSSVASAVVDSQARLGVLPTGTLNHFAKDLRIPLQLEAAADVLAAGKVRNIDVGEVNGRIFINNSSLGIYPRIVMWRDQHRRFGYGRWGSLIRAIIAALRRLPFVEVSLTAGQTRMHRVTPLIFIGNNEYEMEGLNAGTRQCLDSGHLFVCIANAYTGVGLIRLSVSALLGRLRRMGQFEVLSATDARIETLQRRVRVSFDGEVAVMETPLIYRVRPAALRVIAP